MFNFVCVFAVCCCRLQASKIRGTNNAQQKLQNVYTSTVNKNSCHQREHFTYVLFVRLVLDAVHAEEDRADDGWLTRKQAAKNILRTRKKK